MQATLKGVPIYQYKVPEGILQLKVDAYTGAQVGEDDQGIFEYFYEEHLPQSQPENLPGLFDPENEQAPEQDEPSFLERLIGEHSGGDEDRKAPVNPAAKLLSPN